MSLNTVEIKSATAAGSQVLFWDNYLVLLLMSWLD